MYVAVCFMDVWKIYFGCGDIQSSYYGGDHLWKVIFFGTVLLTQK